MNFVVVKIQVLTGNCETQLPSIVNSSMLVQ